MVTCADIPNSGYIDVPAIEVCTMESAKKLGIYSNKDDYYVDGYTDLKTYVNAADASRTKDLCFQSADGVNSQMFCAVAHKNVAYVKRGSECQTISCPSGWSGLSRCTKPLEDAVVSKRSHCDERWYDWFTIPNYHLGNKYQQGSNVGMCFNPCSSYHVPHYKYDPVDQSTFGISSKEELNRCVPRNQYFGGKYAVGSDFCPLAWVYRIGASPEVLQTMMTSNMSEAMNGNGTPNRDFSALNDPVAMRRFADALYKSTSSVAENIASPTYGSMQQACRTLQTPERLEVAYGICSNISTFEGESAFLSQRQAAGDTMEVCESKLKLLKQACNATFCDANNDASYVIKKEPLCFKTESITEGSLQPSPSESVVKKVDGLQFVKRSIQFFVAMLFIGCIIAALVVIYHYSKPLLLRIKRFILRVPKEVALLEDVANQEVQRLDTEIAAVTNEIERLKRLGR